MSGHSPFSDGPYNAEYAKHDQCIHLTEATADDVKGSMCNGMQRRPIIGSACLDCVNEQAHVVGHPTWEAPTVASFPISLAALR